MSQFLGKIPSCLLNRYLRIILERDIIRLWMKKYDNQRGNAWKMSQNDKIVVRKEVGNCVVEYLQSTVGY